MRGLCLTPKARLRSGVAALLLMPLPGAAAEVPPGQQMDPIEPPVEAPDFTLADGEGRAHTLSDYRGKVVMLNFWATWCPPCRREMPSMERLYRKYRDLGFEVVAVNQGEYPELVTEFNEHLSLAPSFLIVFDRESGIAGQYAVQGLPTTYLIDREGKIRYRAIGGREFDHPEVEALIEKLR